MSPDENETFQAALLMAEVLRVLAQANPTPKAMLTALAAVFSSYCRDAKEDPIAIFRAVNEGAVGRELAIIMDGKHASRHV